MEDTKENAKTKDWQSKYEKLKQQKDQMEFEFGVKRAKFKSMYLECESLLKQQKERRNEAEDMIKTLKEEIRDLKSNNEGVQTAAKVTEETRQEEIASLKVKHHEEMVSMEHIWREAIRDARATTAKKFDEELKRLTTANQKLEQQMKDLKSEEKSDGIMSMVSNVIRRGSTMNQPTQSQQSMQSQQSTQSVNTEAKDKLGENLSQAQKNVEAWRSVVMPLEEEISSLKTKLKDANARINYLEPKAAKVNVEPVNSANLSTERLQEQLKELQGYLDAERSSRTDLEMFVAVLNTQKGVLQEDADKLKSELHNVCSLLEQEKSEHRDLKETWRQANEQFLAQQMMLSWEIGKMKELMTPAQMEKLSQAFRKSQSIPAKKIRDDGSEWNQTKSNDDLISFDDERKYNNSQTRSLTPSSVLIQERQISSSKSSSIDSLDGINEDSPSKDSLHPVGSLEEGEELSEDHSDQASLSSLSTSDLGKRIKAQAITVPQEKLIQQQQQQPLSSSSSSSLSHGHGEVSSFVAASGDDAWAVISSPTVAELEKKLHLNETGWSTMKESSSVSHQTCMMCQNYEKQLQRLQKECLLLKERKDSLMNFAKKEKVDLRAEKDKVEQLEKSICVAAEDAQNQIQMLGENENKQEIHLEELEKELLTIQQNVALQMRHISEDRDRIMAELETLREENASLKTIQETLRQDQQQSITNKDGEDVGVLYNKLEQLKINASHAEEQLRSEIMFLKDRVMAEQFDKENTEKILQQDIDLARQEIAKLKEQITYSNTGKRKEDKDEDEEET